MDPRKSATVTAPDLLKAFRQGRGVSEEVEAGPALRIWMAYGQKDGKPENTSFPMTTAGMMKALQLAKEYLSHEGGVVLMVVAKDDPMTAISAEED